MEGLDLEGRNSSNRQTVNNLHRIADAIAAGKSVRVRVNGYRLIVPSDMKFEIELDSNRDCDEIDVELRWGRHVDFGWQN